MRISSSGRLKRDIREGGSIEWSGGGGSNQQAQRVTTLHTRKLTGEYLLTPASALERKLGLLDSVLSEETLNSMVPAVDTVA